MKKKIPTKNYIVLAVIIILTILAVFYARGWYIATKEYNSQNSTMLTAVSEINQNEISNYVLENPKFILYASSGQNTNIKQFEQNFKKYIIDKNLTNTVIYINIDNINQNEITNILKQYANNVNEQKIEINENVNMYIFENKKINHVIKNANELTINQINKLLIKYEMIENE